MNPELLAHAFERMAAAVGLHLHTKPERYIDSLRAADKTMRKVSRALHPGREQYRRRYLRRGRARA